MIFNFSSRYREYYFHARESGNHESRTLMYLGSAIASNVSVDITRGVRVVWLNWRKVSGV